MPFLNRAEHIIIDGTVVISQQESGELPFNPRILLYKYKNHKFLSACDSFFYALFYVLFHKNGATAYSYAAAPLS